MNIYVILDWEDVRILDGPDSGVINSYHKGDTVMDGGWIGTRINVWIRR